MVTHFTIGGMLSIHSIRAVYTALSGVEGVTRADVEHGRATVEHDREVTVAQLSDAITLAGCEVTGFTQESRRLPLL